MISVAPPDNPQVPGKEQTVLTRLEEALLSFDT